MGSLVQLLGTRPACGGQHVRLLVSLAQGTAELAVAAVVAELEAAGHRVPSFTLEIGEGAENEAAAIARWLSDHGRRVLVRAYQPLSRRFVDVVATIGAAVLLPLAHVRPAVHRALLGPQAADPKSVLLAAQYLRARGVVTVAEFGPLFSGVHDRVGGIDALARLAGSAAIDRAVMRLSDLRPRQLAALRDVHDAGGVMDLCRVHDVPVRALFADHGPWLPSQYWRMSRLAAEGLVAACARSVREHGLVLPPCGCPGLCSWLGNRGAYQQVGAPDLFAGEESRPGPDTGQRA